MAYLSKKNNDVCNAYRSLGEIKSGALDGNVATVEYAFVRSILTVKNKKFFIEIAAKQNKTWIPEIRRPVDMDKINNLTSLDDLFVILFHTLTKSCALLSTTKIA